MSKTIICWKFTCCKCGTVVCSEGGGMSRYGTFQTPPMNSPKGWLHYSEKAICGECVKPYEEERLAYIRKLDAERDASGIKERYEAACMAWKEFDERFRKENPKPKGWWEDE